MADIDTNSVKVRSAATRGGARLLIASIVGFLALTLFCVLQAESRTTVVVLLFGICLASAFWGWAKLAEPLYFLECDEAGIHYHHRTGSWLLPWQAFLYCAIPQFEQRNMAFIAFKVTDVSAFLDNLPQRLAVRIMTEQRPLFFAAVREGCRSGQCASDLLVEKDIFMVNQQQYTGIKAVFAQRMQRLATATGYDVFIPVSLDEAVTEQLCRKINQLRLQIIQNTAT